MILVCAQNPCLWILNFESFKFVEFLNDWPIKSGNEFWRVCFRGFQVVRVRYWLLYVLPLDVEPGELSAPLRWKISLKLDAGLRTFASPWDKLQKWHNFLQSIWFFFCSYALVYVELKNQGEDAFKPEIYGDTLIIERRISDSTSLTVLKDHQGKQILWCYLRSLWLCASAWFVYLLTCYVIV